ncbi:MAG: Asp-tRNA(Asn)/Glu-tRNA(Gln) amidotransferase subunit GatB [Oscillospiraceae bacterium]|jgi:aspartyl-tRNA(Asn)/glutamyl-tRNA(Gln) amidotransferase subunit B|nr:Asp-tRNA(Asn)/Glu-tRNA(Gln) amidotransferase subunit GatB [Oscillospiraceae bacterium]
MRHRRKRGVPATRGEGMPYETVIGLEVHCELSTKSKIFCACATRFGAAANTQVCPVCSGMPGALPVLNRAVVEYAVRAGLATGCGITRSNQFDRKNYFYPDLPKAYQISQLYEPICTGGTVSIAAGESEKQVRIREIHMEEDAGKLTHDPWEDASLADFNRCGVPLLEIVSQPDMRSAAEAVDYVERLKAILEYIGVSDCKMQEGSLRADVNLSVRPVGAAEFGTRTEMKNINSLRAIARAVEAEAERQIDLIESGGAVTQETRRWDDDAGESYAMRSKEDAQDYKYFPEPDLPPIEISEAEIECIRAALPELPEAKKRRYREELGLPAYDTGILTGSLHLVRLFETAAAICGDPKETANWVMGEVLRLLQQTQTLPEDMPFPPEALGKLILRVQDNTVNRGTAKKIFAEVFKNAVDPDQFIQANGLAQVTDNGAIRTALEQVLAANGKSVSEYKAGKAQALQFLIGQGMKALRGQAPAQEVARLLREMLG